MRKIDSGRKLSWAQVEESFSPSKEGRLRVAACLCSSLPNVWGKEWIFPYLVEVFSLFHPWGSLGSVWDSGSGKLTLQTPL